MVVQTADAAMSNVNAATNCDPGYCLKYTRTWLEIGSKEADAADAWANAIGKHAGDKKPPRGAPLFWTGGTNGHGHICLARGNDMRSTDIPNSGKVGNDNGAWPHAKWNLTYVGWAEGFNGVRIPYLGGEDWRAGGDVYVDKLKFHVDDSQSVSRLRWRLTNNGDIPEAHRAGLGDSSTDGASYTQAVVDSSRWWMQNVWSESHGNGEDWPNKAANALFGPNYTVHYE